MTYREIVHVLGLPVDVVTAEAVLDHVENRMTTRTPSQIVTVNAEFVTHALRDPEFARVLREADLATPDGAGVVWAMRRQGASIRDRVGGSDLIWSLSELAALHGWRVFLLGAEPGVAGEAARVLSQRYPTLHVCGALAGSPSPYQEDRLSDLIRTARTDILLVAYGAPAQDVWIARNLKQSSAIIAMGVGGSFDYVAGRARRAPRWMQRCGLDWLWRLIHQPSRWRRMSALPHFAWMVITGRISQGETRKAHE